MIIYFRISIHLQDSVWNREGKLILANRSGLSIEGQWQDSLMEGEMKIETDEGGWIEGYYHHGVPHGFQRIFGLKENSYSSRPSFRFAGRYFRGIARGFCWQGLFGGGILCGFVDPVDGTFTGSDIAFIYPDFETVLRGQFKDGKVMKGQICKLIGAKTERGWFMPVFTKPSGQTYEFEAPSKKSLGKNPLLQDPWEAERVYVKPSMLEQGMYVV